MMAAAGPPGASGRRVRRCAMPRRNICADKRDADHSLPQRLCSVAHDVVGTGNASAVFCGSQLPAVSIDVKVDVRVRGKGVRSTLNRILRPVGLRRASVTSKGFPFSTQVFSGAVWLTVSAGLIRNGICRNPRCSWSSPHRSSVGAAAVQGVSRVSSEPAAAGVSG